MALCGADFKIDVFLVISAFKSATNHITTLAAQICKFQIQLAFIIQQFLTYYNKNINNVPILNVDSSEWINDEL